MKISRRLPQIKKSQISADFFNFLKNKRKSARKNNLTDSLLKNFTQIAAD